MAKESEHKVIPFFQYANNKDITEFVIPDGITHIGEHAFFECSNLKKIIIPDSVIFIGPSAFANCKSLEEVILPKHLETIQYRAFAGCTSLKKIRFNDELQEIHFGAFADCKSLKELYLPDSLTLTCMHNQLFMGCSSLVKVRLPKGIDELPEETFKKCSSLDIELPESITTLGKGCFEGCTSLTHFPKHVTYADDSCFKNCTSLTSIEINENMHGLFPSLFEGCTNLKEIKFNGESLAIFNATFKNCKKLSQIPDFVYNYPSNAFVGCTGLKEITLKDTEIGPSCFKNCTNLKVIHNLDKVIFLQRETFKGCKSLESVTLNSVESIHPETFQNCTSLKEVKLSNRVTRIGTEAFMGCTALTDLKLPYSVTFIDDRAFKFCNSLKKINIPECLFAFGDETFSSMDSLEYIEVDPNNKKYITPDNIILIDKDLQTLMLYAGGNKAKKYSLKDYTVSYKGILGEFIRPIQGIGKYAFAGAKNLEELELCSCTVNIESSAFMDTPNLKKLTVNIISMYTSFGFKIRWNGQYYSTAIIAGDINFPFTDVEIIDSDDATCISIERNGLEYFENLKHLTLPDKGSYIIHDNAFTSSSLLKSVDIPSSVREIEASSFNHNTTLNFANGINENNFIKLHHYSEDDKYKIYEYKDKFLIENTDTKKIIELNKQNIEDTVHYAKYIINNPVKYYLFITKLKEYDLYVPELLEGYLIENIDLDNLELLLKRIKKNKNFYLNIIKKSKLFIPKEYYDENTSFLIQSRLDIVIKFMDLFYKFNIKNKVFYNKTLFRYASFTEIESLIKNHYDTLMYIINRCDLFNYQDDKDELLKHILVNEDLSKFIEFIIKYNIKDKFLISKPFIALSDAKLANKFFKSYNANTKRTIIASQILFSDSSILENLLDLLTLFFITGSLESDAITNQKGLTFIAEKIFDEYLPNGNKNEYQIVGDDIHRIFNYVILNDEFNPKFAVFFLENFHELIDIERKKSGFIQRVLVNFDQISRTCTSNKGRQRRLKVTVEKCENYLSNVKFDGVTDENKEMAELIGEWYDHNNIWLNAQLVYKEALKAPRNIFSTFEIDENENVIYSNDPEEDIKEKMDNGFTYEWLPKQDYDNFVLGKYCNCCAHLNGAGQGIMRASMILDNCQNLVIRDESGLIIAKSTLCVNKNAGYAVFNNVETSLDHKNDIELLKIYQCFLKGTEAFVNRYNQVYPDKPINQVNVGTNRNTILDILDKYGHPNANIKEAIPFGNYSLQGNAYHYNGDWKSGQKLVLKVK